MRYKYHFDHCYILGICFFKGFVCKITNILVSTFARNSIYFNLVCHTGCCDYMHDVTMTLCAPSIKMYTKYIMPYTTL